MQHEIDYGTGQKKLGIYIIGFIACSILTCIAFYAVMSGQFLKWQTFTIVYAAACIQFVIQLICFLRLNTQTEQAQINVISLVFTAVILTSIIVGSLWIMWNLNFNMIH